MTISHKVLRSFFVATLTLTTTSTFTLNAMKRLRDEPNGTADTQEKKKPRIVPQNNKNKPCAPAQCTFSLCEQSTMNTMIDLISQNCADSTSLLNAIDQVSNNVAVANVDLLVKIVSKGLKKAGLSAPETLNNNITEIQRIFQKSLKNANDSIKNILLAALKLL